MAILTLNARNQTIPQILLRKKDEPNKNWIFLAPKNGDSPAPLIPPHRIL